MKGKRPFAVWIFSLVVICSVATVNAADGLKIEFVQISGGQFLMGCPSNPPAPWSILERAQPQHLVSLSPFAVSTYPITIAQFCRFLNATHFSQHLNKEDYPFKDIIALRSNYSAPKPGKSKHAVRGIKVVDAENFCVWISAIAGVPCRLPTEAEWEYMAKGSSGRSYPWGEKIIYRSLSDQPVGAHADLATAEGVYDLNGPVTQWCLDKYDIKFYERSPVNEPVCTNGMATVVRGGPMFRYYGEKRMMPPSWFRFHGGHDPQQSLPSAGFRIVVAGRHFGGDKRALLLLK